MKPKTVDQKISRLGDWESSTLRAKALRQALRCGPVRKALGAFPKVKGLEILFVKSNIARHRSSVGYENTP